MKKSKISRKIPRSFSFFKKAGRKMVAKECRCAWETFVVHWNDQLKQVVDLIWPVIMNMLLTLFGWCIIYEMRSDQTEMTALFQNSGSVLYDGVLNGMLCLASVAVLSFIMVLLAVFRMKKFIQFWLTASCLMITFGVSFSFIYSTIEKSGIQYPYFLAAVITVIYGTGGYFAFFTTKLPIACHQFYVICNCSLVSMFYLRVLPGPTAWFLLSSIIIWDIFAVLTPLGPLKQITGFAHDYGEDVLRFLMFSTGEVEPVVNERQTAGADSDESMGSESEEDSEGESEEVKPKTGKKTAFDALNDSSARLGMGDFVFYSLLVGQAASSGSILATIAPMIGIIIGLTITLTLLTDGDEATPALPVSVFFGIILHFGTLHLAEPMLNQAFMI